MYGPDDDIDVSKYMGKPVPPKRYTYEELPLTARMIIEHGDPLMDDPGFYKWEDGFWYDGEEPEVYDGGDDDD